MTKSQNPKTLSKGERLARLQSSLAGGNTREGFDFDYWIECERDVCYMIEKITHQKVDDDYPAMKFESFKEAIAKNPNFKQGDK